jgi:hypothetical protein
MGKGGRFGKYGEHKRFERLKQRKGLTFESGKDLYKTARENRSGKFKNRSLGGNRNEK